MGCSLQLALLHKTESHVYLAGFSCPSIFISEKNRKTFPIHQKDQCTVEGETLGACKTSAMQQWVWVLEVMATNLVVSGLIWAAGKVAGSNSPSSHSLSLWQGGWRMEGTWSEHFMSACIPCRVGTEWFVPSLACGFAPCLSQTPFTVGCCCICAALLLHEQLHLVFGYRSQGEVWIAKGWEGGRTCHASLYLTCWKPHEDSATVWGFPYGEPWWPVT